MKANPDLSFSLSHPTELNLRRKFKPLLWFDFDKLNFVGQRGARLVKLKKFWVIVSKKVILQVCLTQFNWGYFSLRFCTLVPWEVGVPLAILIATWGVLFLPLGNVVDRLYVGVGPGSFMNRPAPRQGYFVSRVHRVCLGTSWYFILG